MNISNFDTVISDADGTLVDTVELIRKGQYQALINHLASRQVSSNQLPNYEYFEEALHQSIGGDTYSTLRKTASLIYENFPEILQKLDFDELNNGLSAVQDQVAPSLVKAYDGLSDFLFEVGRRHLKFAIVTSGSPHHIVRNFGLALPDLAMRKFYEDQSLGDQDKLAIFQEKVRNHFGIKGLAIITCHDVAAHKPDPESILLALTKLQSMPEKTIGLGDHVVDIEACRNAQVKHFVGVSHGFNTSPQLKSAGAERTIRTLADFWR